MLLLQPFQEPLGSSSPDGAAAMETSFSLIEEKTEEGEDDEEGRMRRRRVREVWLVWVAEDS